jgi:hypothetical protein
VQYQIGQPAEKRLPLSHLEIVHGRLINYDSERLRCINQGERLPRLLQKHLGYLQKHLGHPQAAGSTLWPNYNRSQAERHAKRVIRSSS